MSGTVPQVAYTTKGGLYPLNILWLGYKLRMHVLSFPLSLIARATPQY